MPEKPTANVRGTEYCRIKKNPCLKVRLKTTLNHNTEKKNSLDCTVPAPERDCTQREKKKSAPELEDAIVSQKINAN